MTSKISFSKFVKENIRQRGWLMVLSFILLLLSETVYTMLLLEAALTENEFSSMAQQIGELRKLFPCMLNGSCSLFLEALLFLIALLCAATGFSYLHSTEQTDFRHSFPLQRTQWFSISYTGGLVIFVVPYLAASLLTILAGARYGIMTPSILGKSCMAVLGGVLAFLLVYHTAILAMVLTGKMVTGVLAALALSVYGSMAGGVGYNLASYFFSTYSGQGNGLHEKISGFLSPFVVFSQLIGDTAGYDGSFGLIGMPYYARRFLVYSDTGSFPALLAFTVVFLAVLWALSLFLYKKRPSEAAGNALAFPKTASVIKVLISIPTALYVGMLTGSLSGGSTKWIILLSILSAILLCGLIEFIYHMDLRRLLAGKYSSLISVAGVALILCVFRFDLFGFDSWLPEDEKLESMAMSINGLSDYFCYPDSMVYNSYGTPEPDFLNGDEGRIYEFEPIYKLAEEGVENAKNGITVENYYRRDDSEQYVAATIRYCQKSGKSSDRNYALKKETVLSALESLCEDESYRKALFPVFYMDVDKAAAIRLNDIYKECVLLDLSKQQQEALFDAYEKDVLSVDIMELHNEFPVGELLVDLPVEEQYNITVPNLYLYESYENTLSLLEEYGYTIRREIDPDDVELMKYISPDEDVALDADAAGYTVPVEGTERIVSDKEEMQEILSQIHYPLSRLLGYDLTSRSVEITFKGSTDICYFPLQ